MAIERRIETKVVLDGVEQESNIIFHEMEERGDWSVPPLDARVFVLRGLWPQVDGSAETWPQWARDSYLLGWSDPCSNHSAGGATHLFAVSFGSTEQCGVVHDKMFIAWSDGFAKLSDPGYTLYIPQRSVETHGWVNWYIDGTSSNYYPDQGQRGTWCWCPFGFSDVVDGGGLPYNRHVSWFAVWEQMTYADYRTEKGDPIAPPATGEPDIEFAKAVALELVTKFTAMRTDGDGVRYGYMQPEEVVGRATMIEQLLREAYEEQI